MATKKKDGLRSIQWFGRDDIYGFIYRSWMKNKGIPHDQFDGRPVIGICNTWSELVPCNSHFRVIAQHVRDGVLEAGGFPLEFPVMSLGETLLRPTAMLYRNLVSMDVEESIRGNPLDGVVLLVGCDKTTPALLMGAASVDLPTVAVSGDIYDAAVARLHHVWRDRAAAQELAGQVDRHDAQPFLDRVVDGRLVHAGDACVVDEHVDLAQIGHRLCRCALDRRRVGHVDLVLRIQVPDTHFCPGGFQALDDGCADALHTPGNDRSAALEIELVH